MKAFVIRIKDNPRSCESAERCIKSAKRFGIDVEPFDAVTPKDNPEAFLVSEGIPLGLFKEQWSRWQNVLSCFSSHYSLWKKCIEDDEYYLIFEHDAVVKDRIPLNKPFQGLLSLGKPSYGKYNHATSLGVNRLFSKQYLPGAHAYIIKPGAAEILVERAKRDACPTDVFIGNLRFDFIQEYYPWPVDCEDSFTTVQNINGCQAKHNYKKFGEQYEII